MRIALIAPPWLPVPPPTYGGTESVVDRLARGFAAAGHDVLLYTTGDSTCPVPKASVYARHESENLGDGAFELRHLIHAYRAVQDYDIIHDHTVIGPVYSQQYVGLRVVSTNHGRFSDELADIYLINAGRVPLIAVSYHQASTAGDIPVARVIHHGVDPEAFPVGEGGGGYFAFLGRMNPDKGVHEAVEVVRAAGARLKIAAKMREPAEHEYFNADVKPLLDGDIEFLGELGFEDKTKLLGDARALLNPIRWPEPFGLVMVEALACGTPVIGTPYGAAPEIIEDGVTGYLRPDPAGLAAALHDVGRLDRAACRAKVDTYFCSARMVRDHLEFYGEILGS